jgi:hypothetical protein
MYTAACTKQCNDIKHDAGPGDDAGSHIQPTAPTSAQLIERARAAGSLSEEQALSYEVFSVFRDKRLPAPYQGDDSGVVESSILSRLRQRLPGLSRETRDVLVPFLMRPDQVGSWLYEREHPAAAHSLANLDGPLCTAWAEGKWQTLQDSTGHFKVWYRNADEQETALLVKQELETNVWRMLIGTLKLQEPPEFNPGDGCYYGGDDRYDVFLTDIAGRGLIGSELGGETRRADWDRECPKKGVPSYIYINPKYAYGDFLKAAVAHEFMHAIFFGYKTQSCNSNYGWLREATATWAEDYVYPKLAYREGERGAADCYMNSPEKSLQDASTGSCKLLGPSASRDYGAYLFFQFINYTRKPEIIKSIFDSTIDHSTSVEAVDQALRNNGVKEGLHDVWGEFSKLLLNRGFVASKSFKKWDELALQPAFVIDKLADVSAAQELKIDRKIDLGTEIKELATKYYHFTFIDPNTRSISFFNGFFDQYKEHKAIKIYALWLDDDGQWHEEDWTKYKYVGLCRDIKKQRAAELTIVVSNGEWTPSGTGVLTASATPFLRTTSLGCWKYTGTATDDYHASDWTGPGRHTDSTLSYQIDASFEDPNFEHPLIPDSRGVGATWTAWFTGDRFTFSEDHTDSKGCRTSSVHVSNPMVAGLGFMMINSFPEIRVTDPTMQHIIDAYPLGTYVLAATPDVTTVKATNSCSRPPEGFTAIIVLLATSEPTKGDFGKMPVANVNGDLVGQLFETSGQIFNWDLKAQRQ